MEDIKKILIVDDHPLFRKGLIAALEDEKDIKVTGEAGNSTEALKFIESSKPDIVILDINLPGMSGIELSKEIKGIDKNIIILLLTMYKEEDIFNASIDLGINAYLLKENAIDDLKKAIRITCEGGYYLSPSISEFAVKRQLKANKLAEENPGIKDLTEKEKEVLKLIAINKSTKEIASELSVSYKTIENHRANICRKLKISGNNALLKFLINNKDKL